MGPKLSKFDSVDFLNLVVELHEATGLEIPEKACPRLCAAYLIAAG
jgi:acyl carrier protein